MGRDGSKARAKKRVHRVAESYEHYRRPHRGVDRMELQDDERESDSTDSATSSTTSGDDSTTDGFFDAINQAKAPKGKFFGFYKEANFIDLLNKVNDPTQEELIEMFRGVVANKFDWGNSVKAILEKIFQKIGDKEKADKEKAAEEKEGDEAEAAKKEAAKAAKAAKVEVMKAKDAETGTTALHDAAIRGHPDTVKALLEYGPDLETLLETDEGKHYPYPLNKGGNTALHFAAYFGTQLTVSKDLERVELAGALFKLAPFLIELVMDMASGSYGQGQQKGHSRVVDLLLEKPDEASNLAKAKNGRGLTANFVTKYPDKDPIAFAIRKACLGSACDTMGA
jgi:hypothetical protein